MRFKGLVLEGRTMTTWITICDTCKRDGWQPGADGHTDGQRLASLIESCAGASDAVRIRRHSCLMGCAQGCNVAIQGAGKLSYTLGNFEPDAESAEALVEYAELYSESDTGQVPYRQWPQGVKGHFVTRHPPLPED
jgi:predicted metal-binding protein